MAYFPIAILTDKLRSAAVKLRLRSNSIAKRHQVEEALWESEARYRTLIEAADDEIALKDSQGRYVLVNSAFARTVGMSIDEIIGKTSLDVIAAEDREGARARDLRVLHSGEAEEVEEDALTDSGLKHILARKVPVKNEDGDVVGVLGIARDITERKRMEEALRENEERYRSLFDTAPVGYHELDPQGRVTRVNETELELLGYRSDEILGRSFFDLITDDEQSARREFAATVAGERPPTSSRERTFRRRDGTTVPTLLDSRALRDGEGRITGFRDTMRDISGLKQAERALKESEARYRALFEGAGDPIYLKDAEGRYIMVNAAFKALFDSSDREEIYGKTPSDLYPQPLASAIKAADLEALDICRTVETENELMTPQGPRVFFGRKVPLRDDNGQVTGLLGISRDITERRRAEEENRRLALALSTTSEAVIITEIDTRVSFVNPVAERMFGYAPDEMIGMSGLDLYRKLSRDSVAGKIAKATRGDGAWTGEVRLKRKDGQEFPARLSTALMTDQGGEPTGIVGIAADISERKLLEEELLQAQKMEAIGQLAGGVAHDFSNLLTAIIGYSQLGAQNFPSEGPLHHYFEEIRAAADRAADLTGQLLAFSRRQVFEPRVVSLNEVVRNLEGMLRRLIGEHIELEVRLGQGVSTSRVDPRQIEQVLVNLSVNARDSMPGGGNLVIETRNVTLDDGYVGTHPEAATGQHVCVSVTDSGAGMTDEVRARIFEPFFTTKEVGKGTGLGLSTCYGIVAQSGGHITVESEPYRGTTFSVFLPQAYEEIGASPAPMDRAVLSTGSETILLVEDEPSVRDVVAKILREQGYSVLEASNGVEAIQLAQERADDEIAVLLTDVIMPVVGGVQLARQFAKLHPETRVVYTSGYSQDEVSQYGALDPGAAFVPKPFTPAALTSKIREALDG